MPANQQAAIPHLRQVDRQVEQQQLAQVVPHTPALTNSHNNRGKVVVRQYHLCSLRVGQGAGAGTRSRADQVQGRGKIGSCLRGWPRPWQSCHPPKPSWQPGSGTRSRKQGRPGIVSRADRTDLLLSPLTPLSRRAPAFLPPWKPPFRYCPWPHRVPQP